MTMKNFSSAIWYVQYLFRVFKCFCLKFNPPKLWDVYSCSIKGKLYYFIIVKETFSKKGILGNMIYDIYNDKFEKEEELDFYCCTSYTYFKPVESKNWKKLKNPPFKYEGIFCSAQEVEEFDQRWNETNIKY